MRLLFKRKNSFESLRAWANYERYDRLYGAMERYLSAGYDKQHQRDTDNWEKLAIHEKIFLIRMSEVLFLLTPFSLRMCM